MEVADVGRADVGYRIILPRNIKKLSLGILVDFKIFLACCTTGT